MSITIKDIARLINVSHTTVSRALNDSPLISETTKNKVRKVAEKYNYRPNVNARSLVLAKSYNIGLFFTTIKKGTSASFFLDAVRGVNGIIRDNYSLSVEGLDDFQGFGKILPRYFDGIILMSQSIGDDPLIKHVIRNKIPFVLLNRETAIPEVTTVLADDSMGAFRATEWLIRHGHRRIGIIEGRKEFKTSHRRKQGYLQALEENRIVYDPTLTVTGNYDLEGGYKGMYLLLNRKKKPTAVFCLNDDMAVGAMKAIFENGLKIPGDISLIGFDDSIFASYLTPALTSVSRPIEKMSARGTEILLEKMNGKDNKTETIYLRTELKIRDSVRDITQNNI
ncbi:MAG: LacI family DNA-binding transcriptional regulator [Cyclobacteriaceae bacterium]|nr:LacI family DNA-binding transcriptional regulator [Cyclobacteriaceae bacterium]